MNQGRNDHQQRGMRTNIVDALRKMEERKLNQRPKRGEILEEIDERLRQVYDLFDWILVRTNLKETFLAELAAKKAAAEAPVEGETPAVVPTAEPEEAAPNPDGAV